MSKYEEIENPCYDPDLVTELESDEIWGSIKEHIVKVEFVCKECGCEHEQEYKMPYTYMTCALLETCKNCGYNFMLRLARDW